MNPVYFLDKASIEEIEDYLEGVAHRPRNSWEQTRILAYIVARIGGCNADTAEEFLPLPWDEEDTEAEDMGVDRMELERLRENAKRIEKSLKDGRYTM